MQNSVHLLNYRQIHAETDPERDRRTWPGFEHVPAFCLAARLANLLGELVVWMYLHGELFVGKEDFDQQRIVAYLVAMGAKQCIRIRLCEFAERAALLLPGLDETLRPGEPGLADRLGGTKVVPGRQVPCAPGAWAEERRDAKRGERRN